MLRQALNSLSLRKGGSQLCPALSRLMASQATTNGIPVEVRWLAIALDELRCPRPRDHTITWISCRHPAVRQVAETVRRGADIMSVVTPVAVRSYHTVL